MKKIRCAIYTRKSSEEGLEQDFNSLHAQREACAAYVLSQASEGWSLLPEKYDDGGLSGGTLERPALQRLLSDIEAGKIDIVVVYKVDRLTRSLLDFAKLVETLDAAGTSFVSVTQSFNTTNSMGRLTLNMLLSFAQFEREVTAERIRDKIAASKAKGMWMGGNPPLGYKPEGRTLVIVGEHAELIRQIFRRYLVLSNVRILAEELEAEDILVPIRTTSKGKMMGGGVFKRGQLYAMLSNPVYIGKISHKGELYQGQHQPIIDDELWDAVQSQLTNNTSGPQRGATEKSVALLAGLVRSGNGEPLVSTHASKHLPGNTDGGGKTEIRKKRYRYYVSRSLQMGTGSEGGGIRMPAQALEDAVVETLAARIDAPLTLIEQAGLEVPPARMERFAHACNKTATLLRRRSAPTLRQFVTTVELTDDSIAVALCTLRLAAHLDVVQKPDAPKELRITIEARLQRSGKVVRLIEGGGRPLTNSQPLPQLVRLLKLSRQWWNEMRDDEINATEMAKRHGVDKSYVSRVIRLSFLSPKLVEQLLDGKQHAGIDAKSLLHLHSLPINWQEQERLFLNR